MSGGSSRAVVVDDVVAAAGGVDVGGASRGESILWTRKEPSGKVPTTGIDTWECSDTLSEDGVESDLVRSGMLELPLGAGDGLPVLVEGIVGGEGSSSWACGSPFKVMAS